MSMNEVTYSALKYKGEKQEAGLTVCPNFFILLGSLLIQIQELKATVQVRENVS